jgi:isopenicillin-N epimerase
MSPQPDFKSLFLLDPTITYLAFGSFGACSRPVFEDYQKWQLELEREPAQFFSVNGPVYLKKAREALAGYIHCAPDDLVFTPSPSYAFNIIAKGIDLQPGDQVLSTTLEYGALDRTWRYYCKKKGAEFVRQEITLPLVSKEVFIEEFFRGLTSRTKAIFLGEMTSTTALRFPVKEICDIAKQKGLLTIIDGGHVPGHLPLDLSVLQADVYTGAATNG